MILFLAACGNSDEPKEVNAKPGRKESITNAETMEYLERLIDPYLKTINLESEEELFEFIGELDTVAIEIRRELKRDYEQDINAVDI